jgi:hypothetical protein
MAITSKADDYDRRRLSQEKRCALMSTRPNPALVYEYEYTVQTPSPRYALARGAKPIAELVGYGTTAYAHHVTSGPEDGDGARRAMEIAITQGGISAHEIRHLNAHATSTPVGDLGEIEAIRRVFGADFTIAVSGTKSATGHCSKPPAGLETRAKSLIVRADGWDHGDVARCSLGVVGAGSIIARCVSTTDVHEWVLNHSSWTRRGALLLVRYDEP